MQNTSSSYIQLESNPYGALALTILLSEFTPRIIQHVLTEPSITTQFNELYDIHSDNELSEDAAVLCWLNISKEYDEQVSPIERTFYVLPLIRHNTEQSLLSALTQCESYIDNVPLWAKPWWGHIKQYIIRQQNALLMNSMNENKLANNNTKSIIT